MCTVTYIPSGSRIFFTSSRDERKHRTQALPPAVYSFSSGKILFPKDGDAGGTWTALHNNGTAIILLNGAVSNHIPLPPYRKSRGLILLDLINSISAVETFNKIPLYKIEPFSAIVYEQNNLFECIWDGEKKYLAEKNATESHIWSSVTLYDRTVISKREQWFRQWLELRRNEQLTVNSVLDFHRFTGDGDMHNDLLMNRDGVVFTVSITTTEIENGMGAMHYLDMLNKNQYQQVLSIGKTIPAL